MSTRVTEYEIVDHGFEGSQYFQGCGVAYTSYTDVITGCGDNPADAIEDALDSMAQNGIDTEELEPRMLAERGLDKWPITPSVSVYREANDIDEADGDALDDTYYYISIRYNVE